MSKKREKTLDLKKIGKQGFPTKIQLFDQTNVRMTKYLLLCAELML
jgi:hypothetical protein